MVRRSSRRSHRWLGWLMLAVLLALAGVLMGWGLGQILQARASAAWPSTPGMVQQASVRRLGLRRGYVAHIRYRYAVAGRIYVGGRLHFGASAGDRDSALALVGRYPAGRPVPVFFDPGRPVESVLEPCMLASGAWFALGSGMGLTLLDVLLWWYWRRTRQL